MAESSLAIPAAALTHVARSLLAATPAAGAPREECAKWADSAAITVRLVTEEVETWERESLATRLREAADAGWLSHDPAAAQHARWAADQAPWPVSDPAAWKMLAVVAGDLETLARTLSPTLVKTH